jgi:hypothetical protein
MRKLNLMAAVAATLLIGGTAVAKEKPEGAPTKEKKICKGDAGSTSRIAKTKVCRTKAEWAQMSNQEDLDDSAGKLRGMSRN